MDYRLILVCCLVITQIERASCGAVVNVKLESFVNPSQRKYDLTCCDVPCSDPCDNVYQVCLQDPNPFSSRCDSPDNVTYYSDNDLPDVFFTVAKWTGQVAIKIFVFDIDPGYYEGTDYVAFVYNSTGSQPVTINGTRTSFPTTFSVRVSYKCEPNYYGLGCDKLCMPADDVSGHYTCNPSTGDKVCLQGWGGGDCNAPLSPCTPSPSLTPGRCQAVDLVFVLDSSRSVNNIDPNNWQLMKTFIKAFIDRVTIGPLSYQVGVISFSSSAYLSIKLSSTNDVAALKNSIDALPYLGEKTNLRGALSLVRTQAYSPANGGRPGAYKALVLVYDGEAPSPEYGTLVNEVTRLNAMSVDVSVVSLDYYFKKGLVTRALVESIASKPWGDHLWTELSDWKTLSNTVAPTILANLQDSCLRKQVPSGSSSTTVGVSTTGGSTPGGSTPGGSTIGVVSTTSGPSSAKTSFPTSAGGFSTQGGSATTLAASQPMPDSKCMGRGYCSGGSAKPTCYCMQGYAGPSCEYAVDPCSSSPCNAGNCTSTDKISYTCACLPGFTGARCETLSAPPITCSAPPVTTTPSPQCSAIPPAPCAEFHFGPDCAAYCAPHDSCAGHYTCGPGGDKVCMAGWTGVNCTMGGVAGACTPLCQNGGTCFNQGCCCTAGFTGPDCSVPRTVVPTTLSTNTGSMGSGTMSILPTGSMGSTLTGSSVTGVTGSSVTGVTGSTISGVTGSSVTGVTGSTIPGVTGSSVTGVTGSSVTVSGNVTASTIDPQIAVLQYLAKYIKENFPNLTPIEIQQLLNQLLANYLDQNNAKFADLTQNQPPMFVSQPWPGTGQLANYSVQLEILKAELTKPNGEFHMEMMYNYILTDRDGNVTRISPDVYAVMSLDTTRFHDFVSTANVSTTTDTPHDERNQHKTDDTQTRTIIIIVVVCGVVALLAVSLVIWKLVTYCQRQKNGLDKQQLSPYDSDSFIGHGLYNASPGNTVNKTPGSLHANLQYVDNINP